MSATAHYRHGDVLRSRSVSDVVVHGQVTVPAPPERLRRDWQHEINRHLQLQPGDVEVLPLARARTHWPDYRHCVQAAADWTQSLGLKDLLSHSDIALMACRGAALHHDGAQYGGCAFCNLFLSDDRGLDLHFVNLGLRIPLQRGTVVMFDTCQAHEVIARGSACFAASDFPDERDLTQVFLTWELPIDDPQLTQLLGLRFGAPSSLNAG
ncbi:MAG: hypothetical protein ACKOWD_12075 [Rhodoferax sp.]